MPATNHSEVLKSHINRGGVGGLSAWQGVNRDVGELRTNSQRSSDKAVLSLFSVADMTPVLWVWEKQDSETGN